jgi:hypothetical protein
LLIDAVAFKADGPAPIATYACDVVTPDTS